jgi:hypothetical protein
VTAAIVVVPFGGLAVAVWPVVTRFAVGQPAGDLGRQS